MLYQPYKLSKLTRSTPFHAIPAAPISILSPTHVQVFQAVSCSKASQPTFCMHFSCLPARSMSSCDCPSSCHPSNTTCWGTQIKTPVAVPRRPVILQHPMHTHIRAYSKRLLIYISAGQMAAQVLDVFNFSVVCWRVYAALWGRKLASELNNVWTNTHTHTRTHNSAAARWIRAQARVAHVTRCLPPR
jgi:hypothetical protein